MVFPLPCLLVVSLLVLRSLFNVNASLLNCSALTGIVSCAAMCSWDFLVNVLLDGEITSPCWRKWCNDYAVNGFVTTTLSWLALLLSEVPTFTLPSTLLLPLLTISSFSLLLLICRLVEFLLWMSVFCIGLGLDVALVLIGGVLLILLLYISMLRYGEVD